MKNRSKGITLSYIYFVLNTIITIVISAFIVRAVGKTDYGIYQSMTAFISYLVLLEFGTGTIMSRNISLCKKDGTAIDSLRKNISTIWSFSVLLAVVILIVSVIFFSLIDSIYTKTMNIEQIALGKRIFSVAVLGLICKFLNQTLNGLLIGYECYTFEKALAIIKLLLRTLLVLVLLALHKNVFLVAFIDFILAAIEFIIKVSFCVIKLKVGFSIKYFDKSILIEMLPLAFAMLLQTIVNTANSSVGKFIIGVTMSPENVSIYAISLNVFTMFSAIATLPVTMFMPKIAKDIQNGIKERPLTETLIQPCRLNVLVSGAVAFGFLCIGKQFIKIVYGDDFSSSWLLAVIIILPMFINMTNSVVINVIDVLNKRHVRSLILMISTVLNIVMTIISIRYIGMIGVAASTGIALLIQTVLLNIYYKKKIKIDVGYLFLQSYKGVLPYYLISCALGYFVTKITENIYIQFLAGGATFVLVFAILYIAFGMNAYEKSFYQKIKNKIRKSPRLNDMH